MTTLELWLEQLRDGLAEVRSGDGSAFEVAVLGGLVSRIQPMQALAMEARAWVNGAGRDALVAELPGDRGVAAAEELAELDPSFEREERLDRVLAFDDLCAALEFGGESAEVREAIADLLLPSIRAFPEPWRDLAAAARRRLEPMVAGCADPAIRLWRAIEATAFADDRQVSTPPASLAPVRALGSAIAIESRARGDHRLAAASSDYAPHAPQCIVEEDGLQVWIMRARDGGPLHLELSGSRSGGAKLRREGRDVSLEGPHGRPVARLEPGEHELVVGDDVWLLIVKP